MVYLEYEKTTKQVVEIHETEPTVPSGYDFSTSENFVVGDEFSQTIWIMEVDENKHLTLYSAIRNNPNAQRLLIENAQLKADNTNLKEEDLNNKEAILELYMITMGGF